LRYVLVRLHFTVWVTRLYRGLVLVRGFTPACAVGLVGFCVPTTYVLHVTGSLVRITVGYRSGYTFTGCFGWLHTFVTLLLPLPRTRFGFIPYGCWFRLYRLLLHVVNTVPGSFTFTVGYYGLFVYRYHTFLRSGYLRLRCYCHTHVLPCLRFGYAGSLHTYYAVTFTHVRLRWLFRGSRTRYLYRVRYRLVHVRAGWLPFTYGYGCSVTGWLVVTFTTFTFAFTLHTHCVFGCYTAVAFVYGLPVVRYTVTTFIYTLRITRFTLLLPSLRLGSHTVAFTFALRFGCRLRLPVTFGYVGYVHRYGLYHIHALRYGSFYVFVYVILVCRYTPFSTGCYWFGSHTARSHSYRFWFTTVWFCPSSLVLPGSFGSVLPHTPASSRLWFTFLLVCGVPLHGFAVLHTTTHGWLFLHGTFCRGSRSVAVPVYTFFVTGLPAVRLRLHTVTHTHYHHVVYGCSSRLRFVTLRLFVLTVATTYGCAPPALPHSCTTFAVYLCYIGYRTTHVLRCGCYLRSTVVPDCGSVGLPTLPSGYALQLVYTFTLLPFRFAFWLVYVLRCTLPHRCGCTHSSVYLPRLHGFARYGWLHTVATVTCVHAFWLRFWLCRSVARLHTRFTGFWFAVTTDLAAVATLHTPPLFTRFGCGSGFVGWLRTPVVLPGSTLHCCFTVLPQFIWFVGLRITPRFHLRLHTHLVTTRTRYRGSLPHGLVLHVYHHTTFTCHDVYGLHLHTVGSVTLPVTLFVGYTRSALRIWLRVPRLRLLVTLFTVYTFTVTLVTPLRCWLRFCIYTVCVYVYTTVLRFYTPRFLLPHYTRYRCTFATFTVAATFTVVAVHCGSWLGCTPVGFAQFYDPYVWFTRTARLRVAIHTVPRFVIYGSPPFTFTVTISVTPRFCTVLTYTLPLVTFGSAHTYTVCLPVLGYAFTRRLVWTTLHRTFRTYLPPLRTLYFTLHTHFAVCRWLPVYTATPLQPAILRLPVRCAFTHLRTVAVLPPPGLGLVLPAVGLRWLHVHAYLRFCRLVVPVYGSTTHVCSRSAYTGAGLHLVLHSWVACRYHLPTVSHRFVPLTPPPRTRLLHTVGCARSPAVIHVLGYIRHAAHHYVVTATTHVYGCRLDTFTFPVTRLVPYTRWITGYLWFYRVYTPTHVTLVLHLPRSPLHCRAVVARFYTPVTHGYVYGCRLDRLRSVCARLRFTVTRWFAVLHGCHTFGLHTARLFGSHYCCSPPHWLLPTVTDWLVTAFTVYAVVRTLRCAVGYVTLDYVTTVYTVTLPHTAPDFTFMPRLHYARSRLPFGWLHRLFCLYTHTVYGYPRFTRYFVPVLFVPRLHVVAGYLRVYHYARLVCYIRWLRCCLVGYHHTVWVAYRLLPRLVTVAVTRFTFTLRLPHGYCGWFWLLLYYTTVAHTFPVTVAFSHTVGLRSPSGYHGLLLRFTRWVLGYRVYLYTTRLHRTFAFTRLGYLDYGCLPLVTLHGYTPHATFTGYTVGFTHVRLRGCGSAAFGCTFGSGSPPPAGYTRFTFVGAVYLAVLYLRTLPAVVVAGSGYVTLPRTRSRVYGYHTRLLHTTFYTVHVYCPLHHYLCRTIYTVTVTLRLVGLRLPHRSTRLRLRLRTFYARAHTHTVVAGCCRFTCVTTVACTTRVYVQVAHGCWLVTVHTYVHGYLCLHTRYTVVLVTGCRWFVIRYHGCSPHTTGWLRVTACLPCTTRLFTYHTTLRWFAPVLRYAVGYTRLRLHGSRLVYMLRLPRFGCSLPYRGSAPFCGYVWFAVTPLDLLYRLVVLYGSTRLVAALPHGSFAVLPGYIAGCGCATVTVTRRYTVPHYVTTGWVLRFTTPAAVLPVTRTTAYVACWLRGFYYRGTARTAVLVAHTALPHAHPFTYGSTGCRLFGSHLPRTHTLPRLVLPRCLYLPHACSLRFFTFIYVGFGCYGYRFAAHVTVAGWRLPHHTVPRFVYTHTRHIPYFVTVVWYVTLHAGCVVGLPVTHGLRLHVRWITGSGWLYCYTCPWLLVGHYTRAVGLLHGWLCSLYGSRLRLHRYHVGLRTRYARTVTVMPLPHAHVATRFGYTHIPHLDFVPVTYGLVGLHYVPHFTFTLLPVCCWILGWLPRLYGCTPPHTTVARCVGYVYVCTHGCGWFYTRTHAHHAVTFTYSTVTPIRAYVRLRLDWFVHGLPG